MNGRELRIWRKLLGYTQEDAANELGVTRATIQNWEHDVTPVPVTVHLASRQLIRRWKQRAEFGPVTLVYASVPLPSPNSVAGPPTLTCRRYPDNHTAFRKILALRTSPSFFNPLIIDEGNVIIWSGPQLIQQCEKLSQNKDRP